MWVIATNKHLIPQVPLYKNKDEFTVYLFFATLLPIKTIRLFLKLSLKLYGMKKKIKKKRNEYSFTCDMENKKVCFYVILF